MALGILPKYTALQPPIGLRTRSPYLGALAALRGSRRHPAFRVLIGLVLTITILYNILVKWGGGELKGPAPTYETYLHTENVLPQHNLDATQPEGRHGRYVRFSNAISGVDWHNQLGEMLLNNHCAWAAGFGYVFEPLIWRYEDFPWRFRLWPFTKTPHPTTPLTTLIAGPSAGGPWDVGDKVPRSISADHWENICPPEDRHIIWTDEAKRNVGGETPGDVVMHHWINLIKNSPKRCVEIKPGPSKSDMFPQSFDLWIVGSSRGLSLWDIIKNSPVSKLWRTSPLINYAVQRNERLFQRGGPFSPVVWNPYEQMMAIHILRKDYEAPCADRAKYASSFYGWNLLPFLPDRFRIPSDAGDQATPDVVLKYKDRCYPSLDQLVMKVRRVKREWELENRDRVKLDTLFISTDGDARFIRELKEELRNDFEVIVPGQELMLNDEMIGVRAAIDMDIARRAAVFLGNGFSAMTSNIIHRRLLENKPPHSNRFW